ncbi:EscE/YscE/SsaE family type III secretion system needle protein co-chaperone [Cupriavidus respiraculi]|uniref:EscE/YscE/SsaE family type III secretion system needle protein co-chaperone n=1 Tax=Cupriavidus respiraculi TaxID=195930 RepID=UPI001C964F52|nr:EscE/YscE/SsaE family type III secretion system needle protein co-chaperone [Cupriavidus respiraculi]MBY4948210.1 EscE/YscE/SsaE family type III secretion system needle protein co-chaperone [Cupriavidus respiraculi]
MHATDLEARLAADADGSARTEIRRRLETARTALRGLLRQPQRPEDYQRLRMSLDACDAGVASVEKIWRRMRRADTPSIAAGADAGKRGGIGNDGQT